MTRVVFSGILPGGEIWNTGFWMVGSAPADEAAANILAQELYVAFISDSSSTAFATLATAGWSNGVNVDKVTVYSYPSGGGSSAVVGAHTESPTIGSGGPTSPDQVCYVLTLRTGLSGRQNRGRMYLPANRLSLDSEGLVSSGDQSSIVGAFGAGMTAWNLTAGAPEIVVLSQTAGAANLVTSVDADRRPDIQRRRANRQDTGGRFSVTL